MNFSKPNKTTLQVGGVLVTMVVVFGLWRSGAGGGGNGEGLNLADVATLGYQQGEEKGRAEGEYEGRKAAILPTIGDASVNAEMALEQAAAASQSLIESLACARKAAWLDEANRQASQGLNPVRFLEETLRASAIDPFKDLTVRYGTLNGSGEQFTAAVNVVVENRAIVLALGELNGNVGARCQVDLTAAYTANTAFLFESQRAQAQKQEIFEQIEDSLSVEGVAANDDTTPNE